MLLSVASLFLALSPLLVRSFGQQSPAQQDAENQVNSGLYHVRYCGTGPGSRAEQMLALLPKVLSNIQPLRDDILLGTHSPAFWTFFKSKVSVLTVSRIFRFIALGKPMTIPARLGVPSEQVVTPSFLCVENLPGNSADLKQQCTRDAGTRIMNYGNSELILLCPSFWELPDEPTIDFCPRLRRNRMTPNDDRLIASKYGALIHQLAQIYIRHDAELKPTRNWAEVARVMDAVELSASRSLGNALNYAMYASAKKAGCKQFPNMALLRNDEFRHLLEDDGNSTTAASVSSDVLPSPSTVAASLPSSLLAGLAEITAIPYTSMPAATTTA